MKIDSSLRPFEKKAFFLDLNGFPQEAYLIKNLKLLGARHEPVFSKYVSFVVSNKVPLKATPATWNQRPHSPLTPKSNGMCPSPQLLSDCPMDYLDSSVYAISPNTDQNPPSPKVQSRGMALLKKATTVSSTSAKNPSSPKVQSRGMALLKKATQKVKENHRGTDLLEHCKRWGIKVYHVDKILSKVKKYTNLIAAEYAKKKDQKKKNSKNKDECSSDVKKLRSPFIKFEDSNRKFKPVFQEFTSWTDVIDSSLSRNINQLNKQFKKTGNLLDVTRPIFAEINLNADNNFPKIHSPHANDSHTKSYTHTKLTETLKPSNSTSVQVSTVIHPINREKENTVLVKNKRYRKRARTLYCEICHKNYINLDEHMNTEKHKKFMSNPLNFLVVQNIVTSLPKRGDQLFFKPYVNCENNNMSFSGSFFGDTGFMPNDNAISQPENIDTIYDPVFNINDLPTEPYSFLDPEVVSPSCSSPDIGPLPFLEDSLDKLPEKPLLLGDETGDNNLDFSREKKPEINEETPLDFSNVALVQNASLNVTKNCISNDIVSGLTLANDPSATDVIEDIKCREEPVLRNLISVSDTTKNVFAENYLHTESEFHNNVEPHLCAQPFVVHLSNPIQNKLPEESLNNVQEKGNCDHVFETTNDSIEPLLEIQPGGADIKVDFNSVDVKIHGKRKKRKQTGTENSDSRSKQKRRRVKSKSTNGSIKKRIEVSVLSCNSTDFMCNNVSSVQTNLLSQSLLYTQAKFSGSDETCDSQDSAIVVRSNDICLKTDPTFQNAENASKSVPEAFKVFSEITQTFEKLNPSDCTNKRLSMEYNTESSLDSPDQIKSEETCDSQDSAIVVPLNDIDSTDLTTFENRAEYIPESASDAFHICYQTAMAFEIVNPKDCKKRRSIESSTSDSEDLNYLMGHEMFQNCAVDSGIDMPPPSLMHFTLNSSFEKYAEKEAEPSLNLDTNCSVISVNSFSSANYDASGIDLSVQRYLNENETESSINLDKNCYLDASVNSCISANGNSSIINCPFESKATSVHLEEESTYLCQSKVNTSANFIHEDSSVLEVHSMDGSRLETSATHTTICSEQDKKTVPEPVNTFHCSGDILNDNLSVMPVISSYNKHNVNNIHPKCYQILENEDNYPVNFVEENKKCSLEIPHNDFDNGAVKINKLVCNHASSRDQSLIVVESRNPEIEVTDLAEKKNKSSKDTVRSIFLTEYKHLSYNYGNTLQLLHVSGIEFHECLFICSLGHCLAGSEEIFAAETPKLQECLISVDSTIKISSVKQNPACHYLDMLKSYSNKGRWNLLLVKMEDLKLESGFIGLILAKCQGKALITLSRIGNKGSVSKNFTTSPKPSSPVFVTILFPYQDFTTHDRYVNKNDEMIRNAAYNSFAEVCEKSLVVSQPLNLCTKESEQMDMNPLQTSTIFPQLNPYLTGAVGNLPSHSSFESGFEFPSDDCYSYERIAKQLNHASSNLQYVEPISVCSFECEVSCCKPCTCDLGGGKCLPQTCNKFHYFETSSMDSSDSEWALSNGLSTTNQSLLKFLSKPILEVNNITPNSSCEISSTSDFIGGTCLSQTYNNFQYSETNSVGSSDNEWSLPNEQKTPTLNLSKFSSKPLLEINERTSEINNHEALCDDTHETPPLSPIYVVIDDADFESDEEWDTIKSEVDNLCSEFCHN